MAPRRARPAIRGDTVQEMSEPPTSYPTTLRWSLFAVVLLLGATLVGVAISNYTGALALSATIERGQGDAARPQLPFEPVIHRRSPLSIGTPRARPLMTLRTT